MGGTYFIGFVLLGIGALFILIGVIGIYRQKKKVNGKREQLTPPSQSAKEGASTGVIDQMRGDSELIKKIKKVINEKKPE